jgi:hypothetical protein
MLRYKKGLLFFFKIAYIKALIYTQKLELRKKKRASCSNDLHNNVKQKKEGKTSTKNATRGIITTSSSHERGRRELSLFYQPHPHAHTTHIGTKKKLEGRTRAVSNSADERRQIKQALQYPSCGRSRPSSSLTSTGATSSSVGRLSPV